MLNLLLLFCFISHSETPHVGPTTVEGKKGGNVTLPCDYEAKDISDIRFIRYKNTTYLSEIPVCQNKEYPRESGPVCSKGACGIVLKDLNFSDTGAYLLRFSDKNAQTKDLKYHLIIHGEISGNTGQELKLDVLVVYADKVETDSSGEWTEVWTRGHGVSSDRLTMRHKILIINNFTSTDTGTYRVLDSEGQILVTVSLTESTTGSKEKLEKNDPEPKKWWVIVLWVIGVLVALVVLVVLVVRYFIRKSQCQNTNTVMGAANNQESNPLQEVSTEESGAQPHTEQDHMLNT